MLWRLEGGRPGREVGLDGYTNGGQHSFSPIEGVFN